MHRSHFTICNFTFTYFHLWPACDEGEQRGAELVSGEEVDEEVEGGVEDGEEAVGEDEQHGAPVGGPALLDLLVLHHLVNVERHPAQRLVI